MSRELTAFEQHHLDEWIRTRITYPYQSEASKQFKEFLASLDGDDFEYWLTRGWTDIWENLHFKSTKQ